MTNLLFALLMTPPLAIGWFRILPLTRTVSQTALTAAAWWAVFAHAVLTLAAVASVFPLPISVGTKDQIWHFAAVAALCPLIAVLGARFGRLRDWSLFVVAPMVVVLEWPALAQWTWRGQQFELEGPATAAMYLVLLMGALNYARTRFGWSAYLFAGSWVTMTNECSMWFAVQQLILWLLIELAIRRPTTVTGWHRIWLDHRDHFGVVWASRLMARVNEVAERDKWPWRLTPDGFQAVSIPSDSSGETASVAQPESDPRVEQAFRWLLKPFVQPAWIDARLAQLAGDVTDAPPQSANHDALH